MGFLADKRALVVGLASTRSIAWGISQALHREGAKLSFTFQNDKLKGRVEKMAAELGSDRCYPMDVSDDQQIDDAIEALGKSWDGFDVCHFDIRVVGSAILDPTWRFCCQRTLRGVIA